MWFEFPREFWSLRHIKATLHPWLAKKLNLQVKPNLEDEIHSYGQLQLRALRELAIRKSDQALQTAVKQCSATDHATIVAMLARLDQSDLTWVFASVDGLHNIALRRSQRRVRPFLVHRGKRPNQNA